MLVFSYAVTIHCVSVFDPVCELGCSAVTLACNYIGRFRIAGDSFGWINLDVII